jgi:hypothetical protein
MSLFTDCFISLFANTKLLHTDEYKFWYHVRPQPCDAAGKFELNIKLSVYITLRLTVKLRGSFRPRRNFFIYQPIFVKFYTHIRKVWNEKQFAGMNFFWTNKRKREINRKRHERGYSKKLITFANHMLQCWDTYYSICNKMI